MSTPGANHAVQGIGAADPAHNGPLDLDLSVKVDGFEHGSTSVSPRRQRPVGGGVQQRVDLGRVGQLDLEDPARAVGVLVDELGRARRARR